MKQPGIILFAACLTAFASTGCQTQTEPPTDTAAPPAPADAHHGHDHSVAGPHGGHLIVLGQEAFHAEWTHDDDDGRLTVYILDSEMQEVVPISASQIEIERTIGEDTQSFALEAVEQPSAGPGPYQFEIVDKSLIEALKAVGHGVEATLIVEIEGQVYRSTFEHLPHGDGH
jgi:hypothetical protein